MVILTLNVRKDKEIRCEFGSVELLEPASNFVVISQALASYFPFRPFEMEGFVSSPINCYVEIYSYGKWSSILIKNFFFKPYDA